MKDERDIIKKEAGYEEILGMPRHTRYTVDAGELKYEEATRLIEALREKEVEAEITPGGIAIYSDSKTQKKDILDVCKEFGVEPKVRTTFYEENIILTLLTS